MARSVKPEADPRALEAYGALREGVHIAGYSFERACGKLEWLLEADRWRAVGAGFDDVNIFLSSIKLDNLKTVAEQRKRVALKIKQLQPKASNRQIAKVLGVNRSTVDRDTGANAPPAGTKASKISAGQTSAGANAPPVIAGAAAAKLVARREEGKQARLDKVAADEQRVLQLVPVAGKFRTLILDPAWDYDWLSLAGRAKPGYAMQSHEQLLQLDVRKWADESGCHLYLWVTNNFMARGCELMAHWGFQHRVLITWIKEGAFGLGSYFRNSTEHVLFGTLGETTTRPAAASIPTHFIAPRPGEHSEKPEAFYDIVRAASYPPYGEGNQREARADFTNLFREELITEVAE
ncbi:MT-A70 family methyltransferase [Bradyrhizobium sp. 2S1]|uniref:MT-A70 family methyltransferase n=1 Tax=Bradyrhizobium sp. 2S1 TaxID=1404429 RepID=UPI00140BFC7E|nr:MT-A70 family methyltransferase [Bradyrhizobium sp. 2S1]MCK7670880.1 MT-A70 family methyltransferase [Bradyrhizobium sp. 2S1]